MRSLTHSMKRPLGSVALLYAGGLLLAEWIQPSVVLLFAAAFALFAATVLWTRARRWLLCALIVSAGWTNLVWRTAVLSPNDLRKLSSGEPEEVVVRGRLLETPSPRLYVRDDIETFRTLAELSVTSLRRGTNPLPAHGKLVVTTPGKLPDTFFAGQEVEISGVLAPPAMPIAEGLFDYRTYLRRQGIYFELKTSGAPDWQLVSSNRIPPLSDRFLAWARTTLTRGLPEDDKPLRLLWSMTLGTKDAVTSEVYDPFVQSGTMHIFAISGLHIALIAGILVSLLRVLQVSRAWCGVVVIPLIWFYTAATGWQSSAIRSSVMMSVIIGGWALKRPSDLLNSLAAAAWIILLWDPQQLFQASFQLSFFVVLSIALFMPPIERFFDRLLRPDPLLPEALVPRWRRWLGAPLRVVAMCMATSLAAWLGSWPLTAFYFHLFSPVTLLANLLIVPLSSAALACNLGSLICGAWFPLATELFNYSGWFWMWLMMKISVFTIQWPGAFRYVPSPAVADFVIYYGALVAVLSGFALAPKRRAWMLTATACIVAFYLWRWHDARQSTVVTVLPLNGGSAVYCDAPGSANDMLFDCGNTNAVEFILKPFLHGQGVNRLSCLALTLGDIRHVGGLGALEGIVPVGQIATSSARFRSPAYRFVIEQMEEQPERWRTVQPGDSLGQWTVLHPNSTNRFAHGDDNALVLCSAFGKTRVLLLSDLGRQGQNALLEGGGGLRADVVVTGLPDQGEPLCDPLLDAIQPKLIVVTDSEFPATKRAGAVLRDRLKHRQVPVIFTRQAGAVTVSLRGNRWTASTMDGQRVQFP